MQTNSFDELTFLHIKIFQMNYCDVANKRKIESSISSVILAELITSLMLQISEQIENICLYLFIVYIDIIGIHLFLS